MKYCIVTEIENYHYVPHYIDEFGNNNNLGDIFFDKEKKICSVRFYGWPTGIPLVDLSDIMEEIKCLEEKLKTKELT